MEYILAFIVGAGILYWGCWVADKYKRNVPLAAVLTYCFGIFAVIGYYIAGEKDDTTRTTRQVE